MRVCITGGPPGVAGMLVLLAVAACASKPPPPPAPVAPVVPAGPAERPLSDLRREFVDACNSKVTAPDYCDCSWDQMQKTFSVADMNAASLDPARMAEFKGRTKTACADKLPEDVVKAGFIGNCAGDVTELNAYCECAWASYRASFSSADLSTEEIKKTPAFLDASKVVVKACGAKAREGPTRARFLKDCAANPALQPFCACAWTELRKKHRPAEVLTGSFGMDAALPMLTRACGALRPTP